MGREGVTFQNHLIEEIGAFRDRTNSSNDGRNSQYNA